MVGDQHRTATARREVVLAAGAIGSPAILERSGIGDPAHLAALGIATRVASPQVGANLQDHLQLRCAYRITGASTLNQRAATLLGKALIGLEYLARRTGPMAMAPSQLGLFVRSDPRLATPDLEYHVQPLSLEAFGNSGAALLDAFPAFTASVCNLRPSSRGTTRITAADPAAPPAIRPNYLATEDDRHTASQAIRITRAIVGQSALAAYYPEEVRPGAAFVSEEELRQAAAAVGTTIFHPAGTAAMGLKRRGVVDAELRVHGVAGLRVIDASVMPTITSGNTNAPVMMIAEKGAEMVLRAGR
jgi:choline dehydrogenase-like flavoprotein